MPAAPDATAEHIKDVNTRYHDVAAESYDSKWGIDFGEVGRRQVIGKLHKALGEEPATLGEALEIGAGTGYFSLNLLAGGVISRATCTDISPGMLASLRANAERLGLEVEIVETEAERLPFAHASFDLVVGHAVLHHIPDLNRAMAEFRRVLRPGGRLVFCGEPSAYGDRLAALPKRLGVAAAPLWRSLVRAPARGTVTSNGEGSRPPRGPVAARHDEDEHALEGEVDVHAFDPGGLERTVAAAGFEGVRVRGEELLANMYGWTLRTVESTAEPETIPLGWRRFAFRSYLALQRLDTAVLEPRLPAPLFYNLVLSARRAG
jgi:ubiquinone/menaquinone biosynthesis C-methylase UbiE